MIEKVFITSFIVFAIWYCMQPEEIFGKLGSFIENNTPEAVHAPLFDCPVCMAGIYGAIIYWAVWHNGIREWLIVNIAAVGLNAILSKLFRDE